MIMKFKTAKEFVVCMMENEGKLFFDYYGREWKYKDHKFTFKDIGVDECHNQGLKCLHLYGTFIKMLDSHE